VAWFDGRFSTLVGRDDHDIDDGRRLGVFGPAALICVDGHSQAKTVISHTAIVSRIEAIHPWSRHW
jgi:hypothetical protein